MFHRQRYDADDDYCYHCYIINMAYIIIMLSDLYYFVYPLSEVHFVSSSCHTKLAATIIRGSVMMEISVVIATAWQA